MAASNQSGRGQRVKPSMSATVRAALAVLALPLAGLLFPTCLVLGVGMVPTALSFLFDRSRERYLVLAVAMPNFCGVLPELAQLWASGQSLGAAMDSLADPLAWMIAYAAGSLGWLLHLSMPPIMASHFERVTKARLRKLATQKKALVEDWGEDVKQDVGLRRAPGATGESSGETRSAPAQYDAAAILGL